MKRSELIIELVEKEKLSIQESEKVINTIVSTITKALKIGERVDIRGFGSFSVKKYAAYKGRNPKTGEKIIVKSRKLPFFKVGKNMKERIEQKC